MKAAHWNSESIPSRPFIEEIRIVSPVDIRPVYRIPGEVRIPPDTERKTGFEPRNVPSFFSANQPTALSWFALPPREAARLLGRGRWSNSPAGAEQNTGMSIWTIARHSGRPSPAVARD